MHVTYHLQLVVSILAASSTARADDSYRLKISVANLASAVTFTVGSNLLRPSDRIATRPPPLVPFASRF